MRAPFESGDSQFTKEALAEKRLARMEAEIERIKSLLAKVPNDNTENKGYSPHTFDFGQWRYEVDE